MNLLSGAVIPEICHVSGTAWREEAIKNELAIRRIPFLYGWHKIMMQHDSASLPVCGYSRTISCVIARLYECWKDRSLPSP